MTISALKKCFCCCCYKRPEPNPHAQYARTVVNPVALQAIRAQRQENKEPLSDISEIRISSSVQSAWN